MDWKSDYQNKLVSAEEAVKRVKSGDRGLLGPITACPVQLVEALARRKDELDGVMLYSALAMQPFEFFADPTFIGHIGYESFFPGPYERAFAKVGNIRFNSMHLSRLDEFFDELDLDLALLEVTPPDADGYMSFGPMGVSCGNLAVTKAKSVIIQVNSKMQYAPNGTDHFVHVSDVDYIVEQDRPIPDLPQPPVTEIDEAIAAHIVPLIPDGACLQIGLGGLSNAIGYSLGDKKDLSVHTEMFTDSMVWLAKRGAITGQMKAGFGLGNAELNEFVGEGHVHLEPVHKINKPAYVAENDNMISINACLMVDLTGQVCSESIGHRQFSSTGGQVDYVRGANMSKGGMSFLCCASTTEDEQGNRRSSILASLPPGAVVTTPRSDVHHIVTEYGIADLRLKALPDRARAMIGIAHPDFRQELIDHAVEIGLFRPRT